VLRQVAARVPAEELECALLDRLDGLTQVESAEVLGVSERTVRRMLTRFDERLASLREAS
jgi:RNA polymerase sigma-70 factor (ECF subfamily)